MWWILMYHMDTSFTHVRVIVYQISGNSNVLFNRLFRPAERKYQSIVLLVRYEDKPQMIVQYHFDVDTTFLTIAFL